MGFPKDMMNDYSNIRVPCICTVRTANLIYNSLIIATISEEENDAQEFDWVIKIDWESWEKSGRPPITGIDTDLRSEEYIRTYIPEFVEERTLPEWRDELFELGLSYNDRFEYMCLTHGRCSTSGITVERQSK